MKIGHILTILVTNDKQKKILSFYLTFSVSDVIKLAMEYLDQSQSFFIQVKSVNSSECDIGIGWVISVMQHHSHTQSLKFIFTAFIVGNRHCIMLY